MTLAFPVATPDTVDPNMLALRGEPGACFELLVELGFGGTELMVRDPAQLSAAALSRQAGDAGLRIGAVSTGQVRKEDGLSLSALDATARQRAVDRSRAVIDFAATLGAQVNIGTLRGDLPGEGREEALEVAEGSFRILLAHAAAVGVTLAVEPQARHVCNWLNTCQDAAAWSARCGGGLMLLFDVYHATLEERSVCGSLVRAFPRVSWVQFADTDRLPPGDGHAPLAEYLDTLDALGYGGCVSVECRPVPSSIEAAARAAGTLLPSLAATASG